MGRYLHGRLNEKTRNDRRRHFTIMNFRNACRLFADPEFDGDPISIIEDGDIPGENEPPDEPVTPPVPPSGPGGEGEPPEKRHKFRVHGVDITILNERVQYYDKDGKLITESVTDYSKKNILGEYATLDDGKVIYVVTMAKDADTDEGIVIWTPNVYSGKRTYYTLSKRSFCEDILIDGVRHPKFKRQTQMQITASAIENFEEDGFVRPVRKIEVHTEDGYDDWHRPSASSYHEYAKKLCENYRFSRAKYALCVTEKRYIGISKEDFQELKSDLLFLKHCLKTVLSEHSDYFEKRFAKGLSIRKYAQAHGLNRGSVDHLQRKFFAALAQALRERDEADGRSRLQIK